MSCLKVQKCVKQKFIICLYLRKGNQRLTKESYHETIEKLFDWSWLVARQLNANETGKRVIRVKTEVIKKPVTDFTNKVKKNTKANKENQVEKSRQASRVNHEAAAKHNSESRSENRLYAASKQQESTTDAELINALDKLVKLKQQGFLSDKEFTSAKSKLLQDLLK